jgi:hypothetical protein
MKEKNQETNSSEEEKITRLLQDIENYSSLDQKHVPDLIDIYEKNDIERIRSEVIQKLGLIGSPEAKQFLFKIFNEDNSSEIQNYIIRALGNLRDKNAVKYLIDYAKKEKSNEITLSVIRALGVARQDNAIPFLKEIVNLKHRASPLKRNAMNSLSKFDHPEIIPILTKILLYEKYPRLRESAAHHLSNSPGSWIEKTDHMLELIENSDLQKHDLDYKALIDGIKPSYDDGLKENEFLLTDYLIEKSVDSDQRLTSILGSLILESAGNSNEIVGSRIDYYVEKEGIDDSLLDSLRKEVGGASLIDPIINKAMESFDIQYKKAQNLEKETVDAWRQLNNSAISAFQIKKYMSVGIYLIGICLIFISGFLFFFGNLDITRTYGAGGSFLAGLFSILQVTYSGPLSDIQKSVDDLAISNASFIGYVYRILQISNTFSYQFVNQNITLQNTEKTCRLIGEAMRELRDMYSN